MIKSSLTLVGAGMVLALASMAPAHAAVDAAAAADLFKSNGCNKCHDAAKTKKGPSFKTIAEKNKGNANAQKELIATFTAGTEVKTKDGKAMEHPMIDTKDVKQQQNLADWILSH